jgi:hypothetical protein
MAKDGTDWSGSFGQDPAQYADRRGARKSRQSKDLNSIGNRDAETKEDRGVEQDDDSDKDSSDSGESDLGLHDATNHD